MWYKNHCQKYFWSCKCWQNLYCFSQKGLIICCFHNYTTANKFTKHPETIFRENTQMVITEPKSWRREAMPDNNTHCISCLTRQSRMSHYPVMDGCSTSVGYRSNRVKLSLVSLCLNNSDNCEHGVYNLSRGIMSYKVSEIVSIT
jgi:hypothetical protein